MKSLATAAIISAIWGTTFTWLLEIPYQSTALAATETVLHSFKSSGDGRWPWDGVIAVNGSLYGTTQTGGTYDGGTVFGVDLQTGAETVLHSFCFRHCRADGTYPKGLIALNGILYGTTEGGGAYCHGKYQKGCGTVYSLDTSTGSETALLSFDGTDGSSPMAAMIDVNGLLYGTSWSGGHNTEGGGTVFSYDPSAGDENVLYSFCTQVQDYDCLDGSLPRSGVINVKGMFYGTTQSGGTGCNLSGCGTVFSFDPTTGTEVVLYKFGGTADGCAPEAGLVNVKGTLYGTASGGGVNCTQGYGVAFSLDPSTGTEVVVHAFGGGTDGQGPSGGLIHVKGMLYGTTAFGGTYDGGTVFAIDPATGAETVIYSFCSQQNCADGVQPEGNLIHVNGTLYGTTYMGGAHGRGTVFALTLP